MGEQADKISSGTLLLTDGKEIVEPIVKDENLGEKDDGGDTASQEIKRHKINETTPMDLATSAASMQEDRRA